MRRTSTFVVLGGLILLATWTFAPAAPFLSPHPVSPAELAAFDQSAPVIADMNEQVSRLRSRLASTPDYPNPVRDPFRFGPSAPVAKTAKPSAAVPPPPSVDPPPPLPTLAAIVSVAGESGPVRSAVFSVDDDLVTVRIGGSIGAFVVGRVDADAVLLQDPKTGRTFTIR